jgi:hypothetical protein
VYAFHVTIRTSCLITKEMQKKKRVNALPVYHTIISWNFFRRKIRPDLEKESDPIKKTIHVTKVTKLELVASMYMMLTGV